MNHLIITSGNSDVQFSKDQINENLPLIERDGERFVQVERDSIFFVPNRNQKDWLLLRSCRNDGAIVRKHIQNLLPLIHLPIINPTLEFLLEKGENPDRITIIYTDQKDERFRNGDTCNIKEIIALILKNQLPDVEVDFFSIENVTDIDTLYLIMKDSVRHWLEQLPVDGEVYLIDQGGIDQINQSLRLQLLQAFKSRLHILQKAEGAGVKELIFTELFIRDLNKQNIIKHVKDYDFDKVDDTLQPESWVIQLCQYASRRLNLRFDKIGGLIQSTNAALKKVSSPLIEEWDWESIRRDSPLLANKIIIRDLYIAAKIQFLNARYNEFVWRIFTVYENLLREPIDEILGVDTLRTAYVRNNSASSDNKIWNGYLEQLSPGLKQKLTDAEIFTANPNRFAYSFIFYFLLEKGALNSSVPSDKLRILEKNLDQLAGKRNSIFHNMGNTTKAELGIWFSSLQAEGFQLLDTWFGISGMGDFDKYQSQILDYYK